MSPNVRPCVLAALVIAATATAQQVRTGIDVLAADGCAQLQGRKVGLITNHTGRTADGRRTIDVLHAAKDAVTLVALFAPEHGLDGTRDEKVGDGKDEATGLPVFSLYGDTRAPTDAMLDGIDTLVFDVQDAGCRFYTYTATMRNCLEAAAKKKLRFVVLDRPNPIDGVRIEGPVLDAEHRSFTAAHTIPLRHGLTVGELARLICGEDGVQADLVIVPCALWRRADPWDGTGLPWIAPSPNLRRLSQALLYPGIGLLETTNLSVGRGTDTPFEVLGAPWCDGVRLAAALRAHELPGVTFVPVRFIPGASKFAGEECGGVQVLLTDWRTFEPVRTGVTVACTLRALFAEQWDTKNLNALLQHAPTHGAIVAGKEPGAIVASWQKDLELFRIRRKPFLIYE